MTSGRDIVEALANERRVEQLTEAVTRRPLDADLSDLVQMVYCLLLGYPDARLEEADEDGWMNFLLVRLIKNLLKPHSAWSAQIRRFRERTVELKVIDYSGDD